MSGVAVRQSHPRAGAGSRGSGVGEAVGLGAVVELGDELAGGGEHDRVQPVVAVVRPRGEHVLGGGGGVADVDPAAVEVEPERLGVPVAKRQGGGGFGGVGEPHQLGQAQRPVGGGDVPQDAAGTDRGELLVVTDQPDRAAAGDHEVDDGGQGEGVGHPGLVHHDQGGRADVPRPSRAGPGAAGTR